MHQYPNMLTLDQAINWALDLNSLLFLRALIIAMAYTVTQDQRGMKASFYFITIPAQLTPFCMILINLLFPGGVGVMIVQLHGLVAAHLFDFLSRIWPEFGRTRRNLIPTPQFLTGVVNTVSRLSGNIGAVATQASGGATRGSGGPLPDSWRTRGPGQRLG
jgi:Derlin-2/3